MSFLRSRYRYALFFSGKGGEKKLLSLTLTTRERRVTSGPRESYGFLAASARRRTTRSIQSRAPAAGVAGELSRRSSPSAATPCARRPRAPSGWSPGVARGGRSEERSCRERGEIGEG